MVFGLGTLAVADELLFSGPQIGEELIGFEARAVFGEDAGENVSVLKNAKDAPTFLVFVHQVTRPSIALTRLLMNYASTKEKEGLHSQLIFLTNDPTETEAWFRRARRALPNGVSPLISMDGIEGPGVYGLNRKMTLTILVADQGKVTANFPLIQPSVQVDAPRVGHAIEMALGRDQIPTLADMGFEDRYMASRNRGTSPEQDGIYRQMMAPLIKKNATPAEVDVAAKKVEEMAAEKPWFKARVYKASSLIVGGGKLSNYGTAQAQGYLRKWVKVLAPDGPQEAIEPAKDDTSSAEADPK